MIVAIFCIIMAACANLYVPWILRDVIDKVLTTQNTVLLNTIAIGIVIVFFCEVFFSMDKLT